MYDRPLWAEEKIQNNLNYIRKNQNNEFILAALNDTSSLEKKLNEFYSKNAEPNKNDQISKLIDLLNGFDLNTAPINEYEKLELLEPSEIISILQERKEYLDKINKTDWSSVIWGTLTSTSLVSSLYFSGLTRNLTFLAVTFGIGAAIFTFIFYWFNKNNLKSNLEEIENNPKYKSYKHLEKLTKEADDFIKFAKENRLL